MRMRRTRKSNSGRGIITFVIAIALIAFSSIAYATLTQQIQISGNAVLKKLLWNVEFTDAGTDSKSATAEYGTIVLSADKHTVTINNAKLFLPGDYIQYLMYVENTGTVPAVLDSIAENITFTGTGGNKTADEALAAQNIHFTLEGPTSGTTLTNWGAWVPLRIEYDENATVFPKEEVSISASWTYNWVQQ